MPRRLVAGLLMALAIGWAPPRPVDAEVDPRYFPQTGYRIGDERFWDHFRHRGGVRTFGYPTSNPFSLLGFKVQMFQRAILQLQPDGSVSMMNILDDDVMPYTKMNGSTFPAADPEVIGRQPRVGTADYHARALQFVKDNSPDVWEGLKVGFYQTFSATVRAADALPDRQADAGLLQGFNLEIWGLPTSKPAYDPSNAGFVYQRFQRGIMHFDSTTGVTQGLLLADYVKAIMTGRNLPADLAQQARSNRLFGLFDSRASVLLTRPKDLPGTDVSGAFRREPTALIDPGHGGTEVGSSYQFVDGTILTEKDLNLRVANKLVALLKDGSITPVLTRNGDAAVNPSRDLTGDDKVTVADDLQARIDIANQARVDLIVSVHFNGVPDTTRRGTQVFWADGRPFSDRSKALAELAQASLVKSLREANVEVVDRGATPDSRVLGRGSHYYLLGPSSDIVRRPSEMPGIIGEPLFVSNPDDARSLRSDRVLDAVAKGYAEAVHAYFARFPVSS